MARATAEIIATASTDALPEGSTNKYDTGVPPTDLADLDPTASTKLGTIEDNAKDDQSAAEIQTDLKGMADADKEIVFSEPEVGEHKVYGLHRNAAGNPEYDYEDVAES